MFILQHKHDLHISLHGHFCLPNVSIHRKFYQAINRKRNFLQDIEELTFLSNHDIGIL